MEITPVRRIVAQGTTLPTVGLRQPICDNCPIRATDTDIVVERQAATEARREKAVEGGDRGIPCRSSTWRTNELSDWMRKVREVDGEDVREAEQAAGSFKRP
ncbi:hypothetical protein PHLCEN_2v4084 [Hermanssonia centrifuga]|uniref:Uncharacterized protein n=1 Tax=Hermanssonia centrifuga TaxID=98765 RepID=A0A2R6Q2B7_9APHY|nr:hypothetical protein PHLCEN_2v4084 [Hermanssonia centrifuga]